MLTPLRQRIRTATAAAHASLDEALRQRGLADLSVLANFLQTHNAALVAWQRTFGCDDDHLDEHMAIEQRLEWLAHDLQTLNVKSTHEPLDSQLQPRWGQGASAAWGSAYVLLGSTLGGQRLARELAANEFEPRRLLFLQGHGPQTGTRWKRFVEDLEQSKVDPDDATTAADAAFAFFARRL